LGEEKKMLDEDGPFELFRIVAEGSAGRGAIRKLDGRTGR